LSIDNRTVNDQNINIGLF